MSKYMCNVNVLVMCAWHHAGCIPSSHPVLSEQAPAAPAVVTEDKSMMNHQSSQEFIGKNPQQFSSTKREKLSTVKTKCCRGLLSSHFPNFFCHYGFTEVFLLLMKSRSYNRISETQQLFYRKLGAFNNSSEHIYYAAYNLKKRN